MIEYIYIRLLNEGTEVFRPVLAEKINNMNYIILKIQLHDQGDETWEFQAGDKVKVINKWLDNKIVRLAVSKIV